MTPLPDLLDPVARDDLRQDDSRRCVAWPDQALFAGCQPPTARVGIELTDGPLARLLVDRGVRYSGADVDLRRWFATGVLEFDSLSELLAWIDWVVAHEDAAVGARPTLGPAQLTELERVEAPPSDAGPVFLDADELAAAIREEVVGQDPAVDAMARHLRRHLAQADPRRPLTLMAVGPTGVGKTAASERMAASLGAVTRRPHTFLRLDMNEYRERHQVAAMLGSPHGYVGHGDSTPFADALGSDGIKVILFDEIGRAHPQVLSTLMNAMDAGRFTVNGNRTYDCRDAVFVFTSNERADRILARAPRGSADAHVDAVCRAELRAAGMRPELVGRITSFLLFRPLGPDDESRVAILAIRRIVESYGLDLRRVEPEVVSELLRHSRSGGIGVRGLEYEARRLVAEALIDEAEGNPGAPVTLAWEHDRVSCLSPDAGSETDGPEPRVRPRGEQR